MGELHDRIHFDYTLSFTKIPLSLFFHCYIIRRRANNLQTLIHIIVVKMKTWFKYLYFFAIRNYEFPLAAEQSTFNTIQNSNLYL